MVSSSTEAADGGGFDAFEKSGWERTARAYHDFAGRITTRVVEPLLDAAGVGPRVRVLDVASGPGYAAAQAAARGAVALGVDVAGAMVALARARHPGVEFRQGDAQALALADGSFDAVVGNFALHHLGDPERAAGEFARVLVPGGRLALTVWDVPTKMRLVGVLLDAVAQAQASAPPDLPLGPDFFRFSHTPELVRLLDGHGFGGITVRDVSFVHPVSSPDELWHGLLGGTVRSSAVVRAQAEPVRRQIREAFDRLLEVHRVGSGFELPVSIKLAAAHRNTGRPRHFP